jgi:ubiquinone/menaquinone biosynthesis C-methylase UbiE
MSTSKRTKDWYNKNAHTYAKHVTNPADSPYHAYYEKPAIRAELPDVTGYSVLSLGCGSGLDSQYLKEQGTVRSVGVDISEKLIEIAKRDHPDCEFHVMDMEQLSFEVNTFDLVYSSLAMHYLIGGPAKALHEAYRVLKPGGTLLFSDGHPIDTAMDNIQNDNQIQDKRLGELKNKVNNTEVDFGDYLTSRVIKIEEGLAVDIWHQPLSKTLNQIIEAGFVLDKVLEFGPTEGMKKVSLRHYNRLQRIPEMVIFKTHKP